MSYPPRVGIIHYVYLTSRTGIIRTLDCFPSNTIYFHFSEYQSERFPKPVIGLKVYYKEGCHQGKVCAKNVIVADEATWVEKEQEVTNKC